MQTLRPLVVGTDFSECAEQALDTAIKLAIAAGTRLTLVHVCALDVDGSDEQRWLRGGEALTALIANHRSCGVEITGVLRGGRPWEKLDNLAVEVGASLIVIGRHGRGRKSAALGSVAEQLLRFASHPVLTVPCEFNHPAEEADDNDQQ